MDIPLGANIDPTTFKNLEYISLIHILMYTMYFGETFKLIVMIGGIITPLEN